MIPLHAIPKEVVLGAIRIVGRHRIWIQGFPHECVSHDTDWHYRCSLAILGGISFEVWLCEHNDYTPCQGTRHYYQSQEQYALENHDGLQYAICQLCRDGQCPRND